MNWPFSVAVFTINYFLLLSSLSVGVSAVSECLATGEDQSSFHCFTQKGRDAKDLACVDTDDHCGEWGETGRMSEQSTVYADLLPKIVRELHKWPRRSCPDRPRRIHSERGHPENKGHPSLSEKGSGFQGQNHPYLQKPAESVCPVERARRMRKECGMDG